MAGPKSHLQTSYSNPNLISNLTSGALLFPGLFLLPLPKPSRNFCMIWSLRLDGLLFHHNTTTKTIPSK